MEGAFGRVGHMDLEHLAALSWKVRKRSVVAGHLGYISLSGRQIVSVPGKGLTSRHEKRASQNGWVSRTTPAARGTIRPFVGASRKRLGIRDKCRVAFILHPTGRSQSCALTFARSNRDAPVFSN
jgi:hypothetical protein